MKTFFYYLLISLNCFCSYFQALCLNLTSILLDVVTMVNTWPIAWSEYETVTMVIVLI